MDIKEQKNKSSPTGNRNPVSRVTGGDTYHYTIEDCEYVAKIAKLNSYMYIDLDVQLNYYKKRKVGFKETDNNDTHTQKKKEITVFIFPFSFRN